jgi:hypothetical protein
MFIFTEIPVETNLTFPLTCIYKFDLFKAKNKNFIFCSLARAVPTNERYFWRDKTERKEVQAFPVPLCIFHQLLTYVITSKSVAGGERRAQSLAAMHGRALFFSASEQG